MPCLTGARIEFGILFSGIGFVAFVAKKRVFRSSYAKSRSASQKTSVSTLFQLLKEGLKTLVGTLLVATCKNEQKMKGIKEMIPSSADFHYPLDWFGKGLSGFSRTHFETLKHGIEVYIADPKDRSKLINILNLVEETKIVGITESVPVLSEIVKYIRVHLLSRDPEKVYHTLVLCDCLVKNSGYRVHLMIGRRKFMKTIGLITRRNRKTVYSQSVSHIRVANLGLDCIQAWGEAFTSRRVLYPHIYETYYKMRHKYNIGYPRIDFDPTRVPIPLGPVTEREKQLIREYPVEDDSDTSSTVPSEAETTIAKDYVRWNPNTQSNEDMHSHDVIENLTTCTASGAHNPPTILSAKSVEDGTAILNDVRYNPSPIATTSTAADVASTLDIHFNADTQWRIDDYSHLEPSFLKGSQSSGSHRDLSGALVYEDDHGDGRSNDSNLPEPPKKRHNMYMITIQPMNSNKPINIEGATNFYDSYPPTHHSGGATASRTAVSASTATAYAATMVSPSFTSRQRSLSNSGSPAYAEPWYAQRPPTPPATPGGSHSKSTTTAVDKPSNLVPLMQGFYYDADLQDSIFEPPFSASHSSYSGQQVAQAATFRPSPRLPSPKHLRCGSSVSGTPTHSVLPTIADTVTEMEEDPTAPVSNSGGGGGSTSSTTTGTIADADSASTAGGVSTTHTVAQNKRQEYREKKEEEEGADTPKERGEYIPQEFTDPTAEYHDNSISLTDSIAMANIVMSPRNSNISDRSCDSDKSVSVFSQFSTTAVAGGSAAGDISTSDLNTAENPTAASAVADDDNYDDYTNNHTFTDLDSKITEILHNEQHHAPLPLSMPVPQRTTSLNTGMNLIHISEAGGVEDDGDHSATGSFDHKKSILPHPVAMLNVLSEHHPPPEPTGAEHYPHTVPEDNFITPVEIVPVSSRAAESLLEAVNSPYSSPCFAGVVPGVYDTATDLSPATADQQRNTHNKRGRENSRNTVPCGNTVPFATSRNNEEDEEEECMQQDSPTAGDGTNINIGGDGGSEKSSDSNNDNNNKLRQKRAKGL